MYFYSQYPTSPQHGCRPVSPSQHMHSQIAQPTGTSRLRVCTCCVCVRALTVERAQTVAVEKGAVTLSEM